MAKHKARREVYKAKKLVRNVLVDHVVMDVM